ncbi:MAG TPA: hemolysin III family protein [Spirochaetota bacterium]|nr:hemolysin III family protein [Spirochaetota bacterium]HPP50358.1 hemolysin III family protein [Spirochaetota bacterium]
MKRNPVSGQTKREEIANVITHSIGIALGIAGLAILVVFASIKGDPWKIVSFSIYGASIIILYSASTIYHSIKNVTLKKIFQIVDHSSIFILIAGTYTPFVLVNMRGPWGWTLFGLVWGLAISGIIIKSFLGTGGDKLSTVVYLAMGWIIVIAFKKMITSIPLMGIVWLVIGGLCYSLGAIVFLLENNMPFNHPVWHLFVLAGTVTHFFGILFYVLPY